MNKSELRKYMMIKRDDTKNRVSKDVLIKEKLKKTDYYRNSNNIFIYVGFKSEINTINYIKEFLKDGKRVFVPKTNLTNKTMDAVEIKSIDDLEFGSYGILEPKKEKKSIDKNLLDLIIFPGLAFDEKGNRLGYGAGYYDKFVKEISCKVSKVALCYDFQVIDNVPHEKHDIKVEYILTEKREIEINSVD